MDIDQAGPVPMGESRGKGAVKEIDALIRTQPNNPYPGLRSFEPEEDYLFFG